MVASVSPASSWSRTPTRESDEFASYNDVKSHGQHVPVNHQETFGVGVAHSNGIEGFWSSAERLYRHVHGVDPGNFPLDLAEYEFRYIHRGEHLMTLLYDRLIRATVPTQTPPEYSSASFFLLRRGARVARCFR